MITTFDLPEDIVAQAEGVASARNTTLQALIVEGLHSVVQASTQNTAAQQEALLRLRTGVHLGGGKPLTRDEAHARGHIS
jgi:hypothetical protein